MGSKISGGIFQWKFCTGGDFLPRLKNSHKMDIKDIS